MAIPMRKAPKAMKATRTMKAMKKKSIVAVGWGAKARVFSGTKVKTSGGLQKTDLIKNKRGKVVSRAASLHGKKIFVKSGLKKWCDAIKAARKSLGYTGFVAIGGKSAKGR